MREADWAILVVTLVAIFLSFQYEGDVYANLSWKYTLPPAPDTVNEWQRLPSPIICDIDGDGKNEMVVVTREPSIVVLDMSEDGIVTERFKTSLLSTVRVRSGRQPVALAAGYRSPYKKGYRRRMIIVVLTREWTVLCYNSKLELLWENNVQHNMKAEFPSGMYLKEVSILIDAHPMKLADRGIVVVGGSMSDIKDINTHSSWYKLSNRQSNGPNPSDPRPKYDPAAANASMAANREAAHHFSYFAFDGSTGGLRWKHEAGDFSPETDAEKVWEHSKSFKMANEDIANTHRGEVDWRVYRDSVLRSLPHRWQRREDTRMVLAHFDRRRLGGKDSKNREAAVAAHVHANHNDNDGSGSVLADAAGKPLNLPLAHLPGLAFDWRLPHSEAEHVFSANVIVTHLMHGLEVIHLYTGRPLTQLTLPPSASYADINGDGVVDQVRPITGQEALDLTKDRGMSRGPVLSRRQRGRGRRDDGDQDDYKIRAPTTCMAQATSGVPYTGDLWEGNLCKTALYAGFDARSDTAQTSLEAVNPSFYHRRDALKGKGKHYLDTIFLTSDGQITSYNGEGDRNWHSSTVASWRSIRSAEGAARTGSGVAEVSMMSVLASGGMDEVVLAVGDRAFVLLSPLTGHMVGMGDVGDPLTTPVTQGDINHDGVNDLLFTTEGSLVAFTIHRRASSLLFRSLVACLVVIILAVAVVNFAYETPTKVKKLSRVAD